MFWLEDYLWDFKNVCIFNLCVFKIYIFCEFSLVPRDVFSIILMILCFAVDLKENEGMVAARVS